MTDDEFLWFVLVILAPFYVAGAFYLIGFTWSAGRVRGTRFSMKGCHGEEG